MNRTSFSSLFRSRKALSLLTLLLALALPLVVFADNVQNDVVAGGNDTITLGDSTTVGYRIAANNGDGQAGCNVTDGTPALVSILTPANVTASPASLTFTACDSYQSVEFEAAATGNYEINVSVTDSGAGTYNVNPARFTLHVLAPPTPTDSTPPVITPIVVGTLGNNGWYVSDVTITWDVQDDESDITSTSGCDDVTVNSDTTGITFACSATSAGGTSSESVTIKRDATAPEITFVGDINNGDSFYFGSVPAEPTCSASDATSGLASACTVSGYSALVGTHTLVASATDMAGNTGTDSRTYTVLAWTLSGFYSPVNMGANVWNTVKGGSTVPLKFEVFAGSTELTDTALVSMSAQKVSCAGAINEAPLDMVSSGATSLRYDWDGGQFIQNWKTPKAPGTCYVVTMTAADGSALVANFELK